MGHAVINPHIKFEVSIFTHHKDMKEIQNEEIGVI